MEPGTIIDAEHPPTPTPPQVENQPSLPHVRKSHRFLLIYLLVLLVAAISGGVYAWQHHDVTSLKSQVKNLESQNATLQSQVQTLSAPQPDASNNNSPLDYKGWKTFCDTINNACFRYPKDWTISGSGSSNQTAETLSNATTTITMQYNAPVTAPALDQVFYIASINDLNKTDLGLKIVDRIISNTPDLVIVAAKYVNDNNVTAKKTLSFMDNARFTATTNKATVQFSAKPSGAALYNIKSTDQATTWLSSDDAKTCLKILKSFYYQ